MLGANTMHSHHNPERLIVLLLVMALLLVTAQAGLVSIAFHRLGLSPGSALTLLLASLLGSVLNLPLFWLRSRTLPIQSMLPPPLDALWRLRRWEHEGRTIVALNVGGGLIPVLFCAYLFAYHTLPLSEAALAIGAVTAVSYYFSKPVFGVGIAMPVLIAPMAAALFAVIIDPEKSAPLAYVGGTLGVLVGADLLRLKDIRRMGAPLASIGGAGTFDGIFLTGLVAVLLA
jgi:uncharacterized membrane protein